MTGILSCLVLSSLWSERINPPSSLGNLSFGDLRAEGLFEPSFISFLAKRSLWASGDDLMPGEPYRGPNPSTRTLFSWTIDLDVTHSRTAIDKCDRGPREVPGLLVSRSE